MTKYNEDGMKILEQILPYFKPEVTPSVKLLDGVDCYFDIPIILNSVTNEDSYEAAFPDRRALIWTLDFTIHAYYFGPVSNRKVIKFAESNIYDGFEATDPSKIINVYPQLTDDPSVPPTEINWDDDYIIVTESEDG